MPVCFSLLCGWLITLVTFLIKESIIKPKEEALNFTSVTTEETLGYADFVISEHLGLFVFLVIAIALSLFCINKFLYEKTLFIALPASFLVYGVLAIYNSGATTKERAFSAFAFCVLAGLIILLCINYRKNQKLPIPKNDISPKIAITVIICAFVTFCATYIYLLWTKTASYYSPGFDTGIFAQMFDNMTDGNHSFAPLVTCERNELLSHFAVHFSPILYLLAPFCFIFSPLTVMIFAQIILSFSGVFPLFLICRQLKLSYAKSTAISMIYMLYPAIASGSCYDFHENAFLAPLILWTLYFAYKKGKLNTVLTFGFALLTLAVKEDAAIYVAFIALFVFFSQKQRLKGLGLFALSVAYFFTALFLMSKLGQEGVMLDTRYGNIVGTNESFGALISAFFANPALYASQLFTAEKLVYALNMLLPLAFLPLITKKISRFLLICPLVIVNLVTGWVHQYDLGYQYSFGAAALLLYLTALNVADLSFAPTFELEEDDSTPHANLPASQETTDDSCAEPAIGISTTRLSQKQRFINNAITVALVFSIFSSILITAGRLPAQTEYIKVLDENAEAFETIKTTLAKVDRSKTVLASPNYLTHLYDADELYSTTGAITTDKMLIQINYFTDIVVLDARESVDAIVKKYKRYSYEVVEEHEGLIIVLQRTENSPPIGPSDQT